MTKTAYMRVYSPVGLPSEEAIPGFVRAYGLLSEEEGEGDWVADWEGRRLVCPRTLRLRVLESTVAFAHAFRGIGAGLIPEELAQAADRELRRFHRDHPTVRSHALTSAWHVPVRWFSAFTPAEKEVYETAGRARLRYRTALPEGRERVENAHRTLLRLGVLPGPAEEMGQLAAWLEGFDRDSMLELDYGSVSDLFDRDQLVFDDSAELVARSIQALARGDMMEAGECYGRVITRWAPAYSVTFSN